ncbi:hypothetical protein WOLCODRAFT_135474 [Wolfiporia cocos MD-104 SS10]|uniref:Uncharacterized protein n=1 Tax=Wolfiporia cocos (strain MD-104) TaxID=742152 RepID=A0A2H3IVN4_WOLCO|nr:hypothetical protein WOLCODRAFT_135474 [Wolfiporia cocos MD-104 SS10]
MLGPSARPSLPTSSSDFALPVPSTSSTSGTLPAYDSEDLSPLMLRWRRPSLLVPRASHTEEKSFRSPLATSVTLHRSDTANSEEESGSDRDSKMWTDSSSSLDSGANTPPLPGLPAAGPEAERDQDSTMKSNSRSRSPSTPPPQKPSSSSHQDAPYLPRTSGRRPSHHLKVPRILSLISESRPDECEVQSEAQFQRLVASCCELPSQPRVPRAPSDRGRYPEEAIEDEPPRDDESSDDGENDDTVPYSSVEPISIVKPGTPQPNSHGDDMGILDSPGGMPMDVDMQPSSILSSPIMSWRHTPPPTSSVVRSNKRKMEDRYDPYPTANKRRAVSPSISHFRDPQRAHSGSRTPGGTPRLIMPTPIPISTPGSGSIASSPTIGPSYYNRGTASVMSSPTLRPQMGLGSPILRPILPRPRRHTDAQKEREVEGAGAGVSELRLR